MGRMIARMKCKLNGNNKGGERSKWKLSDLGHSNGKGRRMWGKKVKEMSKIVVRRHYSNSRGERVVCTMLIW